MIARLCLVLIGVVLPHLAQAQDTGVSFPALYDVTGVAADDVLNIRATASAASPVLGTLPPDAAAVEVVALSGGWAVVNAADRSGFVALRFLARQAQRRLVRPGHCRMTCLGTEPFWCLAMSPGQVSA